MVTQTTHTLFKQNLSKSMIAVNFVAEWLTKKGYKVEIPETRIATNPEDRFDFVDGGDLYVTVNNERQRVEVKQVSVCFTGLNDWKFKNQFIVCAKHSFDNSDPKPYCYIVVSHDFKGLAFVLGNESKNWFTKDIVDIRYGPNYHQMFYLCKPNEVSWEKL